MQKEVSPGNHMEMLRLKVFLEVTSKGSGEVSVKQKRRFASQRWLKSAFAIKSAIEALIVGKS